jgi:ribosomal-protein-alanine N-acetyltransferase
VSAVLPEPVIRLRPMTELDLPQVLEIERTAYGYPWPQGIFRDCLRVGYCCWVVERNDRIEAYGIMSVAAGEAHLLNLCVRKSMQRMGVGRKLLTHLMELAVQRCADTMFLEVRPSNHAALQLYEGMGFNVAGIRRGYYPALHCREDALILARQMALTVVGG